MTWIMRDDLWPMADGVRHLCKQLYDELRQLPPDRDRLLDLADELLEKVYAMDQEYQNSKAMHFVQCWFRDQT
jgi:hypothetical protein